MPLKVLTKTEEQGRVCMIFPGLLLESNDPKVEVEGIKQTLLLVVELLLFYFLFLLKENINISVTHSRNITHFFPFEAGVVPNCL